MTGEATASPAPAPSPVRILLCDDHVVVRAGLLALLGSEPDIEVVGEAGSGEEAVVLAARLTPDVVLMDLQLGAGIDGVEATRRIAADGTVHVLVLTTYDTDADITRAIEAGATGYLLKAERPEELFAAIHSAAQGRTTLSAPVASRVMARMRSPAPPSPTANATSWPSSPRASATGTSPAPCSSARPRSRPTWAASTTNSASTPARARSRWPRNSGCCPDARPSGAAPRRSPA